MTGAADGSTRYAICASGYCRRSARITRCGENDVADQAQADEENLTGRSVERDLPYGSIVASSISITGMSSLIG